MRKLLSLFFAAVLLTLTLIPCLTASAKDKYFSDEQVNYYKNLGLKGTTINVYNWGEYISDGSDGSMDVVKEFERLTGANVNYTNFESNENMYSKLAGGGVSYDVIVPSDYMIERLIDEDMLLELDFNNIPNFEKYIRDDFRHLFYDPEDKYSVGFNISYTALIYNKKLVKEKPDSWKVLWDEQYKGKVLMFNNSRDAFAIAQEVLGYDVNSTSEQEWVEAAEMLAKQKDAVEPVYVMDEVFNLMESGEYAFATYYTGDYLLMLENNEDLGYCLPKEGFNKAYDAFCVPKCAQNKAGAEAFINFMMEPEVSFENAEYIYYCASNKEVENNPDSSLYGEEAVYPKGELDCNEYHNLPQNILELQSNLWGRVKSGQLSANSKKEEHKIYIISGALTAFVIIVLIISFISKKRREKEQDISDLYTK